MKLINDCKLPEPIFDAMANDQYTGNSTDFSASNIFKGPREYWYDKMFNANPESQKYAFDEQVMFLGTLLHNGMESRLSAGNFLLLKRIATILETWTTESAKQTHELNMLKELLAEVEYPVLRPAITEKYTVEKRFYANIKLDNGGTTTLSGAIDLYCHGNNTLYDYKSMIAYGWMNRHKKIEEWTSKLNFYRLLMHVNNFSVPTRLVILPLIADWRQMGTLRDSRFPPTMYDQIELEVHPVEQVRMDAKARAEYIMSFKGMGIDEMPYCNASQRMQNKAEYKVYKVGAKSCCKGGAFDNVEDAQRFLLAVGPLTHEVREILSPPVNCQYYCKAAKAGVCDAYKKWKVGGERALQGLLTSMASVRTEHEVPQEKVRPDTIDLQEVFSGNND